MDNITEYKEIAHVDLMDKDKRKVISKLNVVALVVILVGSTIGVALNYFLRMPGQSGGRYLIFILAGAPLCVLYIYLHELMHVVAVLIATGQKPNVKFEKLVASCGSPFITYGKAEYFFVASFPLVFFCTVLIPLCALLSPVFFPLPFIPLCYNIVGSTGDMYLIKRALSVRGKCIIVDSGTNVHMYLPETVNKLK